MGSEERRRRRCARPRGNRGPAPPDIAAAEGSHAARGAAVGSRILPSSPWQARPARTLMEESPCVFRWSILYLLNQDVGVPPTRASGSSSPPAPSARSRVPDLGWQARRRRPQAPRCARRRGASLPRRVGPPDAAPRHLAHGAARLQPAQPALVPRHRGGAPERWRSLRRPRRRVLGPGQPHPSRGRGARPPARSPARSRASRSASPRASTG